MTYPQDKIAAAECARLANEESEERQYYEAWFLDNGGAEIGIAFRKRLIAFSDAAKAVDAKLAEMGLHEAPGSARDILAPFILPDPVDPLLEAVNKLVECGGFSSITEYVDRLRAALDRAGLQIVPKGSEQ